jgi:hypothetical protein
MYYSRSTRTLSASLEVPGVPRENVRVTMGTCYFNRIKYVCVVAESDPVFPWAADAYAAPGGSGKRTVAPVREEEEEEEEEEGESEGGGASGKRAEGAAPTPTPSTHGLKAESPERSPAASAPFTIPKFPGLGKLVNPNLRERRFGTSRRVIQVPATTTVRRVLLAFPAIHLLLPESSLISDMLLASMSLLLFSFPVWVCERGFDWPAVFLPFSLFHDQCIYCCKMCDFKTLNVNFAYRSSTSKFKNSTATSDIDNDNDSVQHILNKPTAPRHRRLSARRRAHPDDPLRRALRRRRRARHPRAMSPRRLIAADER